MSALNATCPRLIAVLVALAGVSAVPARAQSYHMADYWLVPQGYYKSLYTKYKTQAPTRPKCDGRVETATHAMWQGTFMSLPGQGDRKVALQGGPDGNGNFPTYDIFEVDNTGPTYGQIWYWGTFRGNGADRSKSNSFSDRILWMRPDMTVGGVTNG